MPLKRAIMPLLDGISDTAASVEAVNTVVFTEDGRRTRRQHRHPRHDRRPARAGRRQGRVGRGAGRRRHGFVRARRALPDLHGTGHRLCTQPRPGPTRCAAGASGSASMSHRRLGRGREALRAPLVIATTPAGATDALARDVPERPGTLFDVLYDPWPTALAAAWSAHGGDVVGGLDLLVHQAVLQVEQMTGRAPAPLAAMRAAGEQALERPATARDCGRRTAQVRPAAGPETGAGGPDVGGSGAAGQGRAPGRAVAVPGASMRSTVEQVALADRGGVARTRTGGDAGGPARRCADHHGDGGGPPRPAAARLRPRCPDEVRARRGHLPRRRPARPDHGLARSRSWWATPSGPSGRRSWRPTRSTPTSSPAWPATPR